MQHDLIQQAYANSVILATPFLLQVTKDEEYALVTESLILLVLQANNPSTWLNPVEVCGYGLFFFPDLHHIFETFEGGSFSLYVGCWNKRQILKRQGRKFP